MGTLLNQQPRSQRREYGTEDEISYALALAQDYKIPFSDVVALMGVLERRRANDLALDNGDIHDEQMAGIGELLERVATVLEDLAIKRK